MKKKYILYFSMDGQGYSLEIEETIMEKFAMQTYFLFCWVLNLDVTLSGLGLYFPLNF